MKILIKSIESKTSSTGKAYHSIETDQGKMSIWDSVLAKDIQDKCIGCTVDAEVETKGQYTNLKLINSIIAAGTIKSAGDVIGESAKKKRSSEMMQCAKDIVIEAYKDQKIEGDIPEQRIAKLAGHIKIVWNDLMKTIGENENLL